MEVQGHRCRGGGWGCSPPISRLDGKRGQEGVGGGGGAQLHPHAPPIFDIQY